MNAIRSLALALFLLIQISAGLQLLRGQKHPKGKASAAPACASEKEEQEQQYLWWSGFQKSKDVPAKDLPRTLTYGAGHRKEPGNLEELGTALLAPKNRSPGFDFTWSPEAEELKAASADSLKEHSAKFTRSAVDALVRTGRKPVVLVNKPSKADFESSFFYGTEMKLLHDLFTQKHGQKKANTLIVLNLDMTNQFNCDDLVASMNFEDNFVCCVPWAPGKTFAKKMAKETLKSVGDEVNSRCDGWDLELVPVAKKRGSSSKAFLKEDEEIEVQDISALVEEIVGEINSSELLKDVNFEQLKAKDIDDEQTKRAKAFLMELAVTFKEKTKGEIFSVWVEVGPSSDGVSISAAPRPPKSSA